MSDPAQTIHDVIRQRSASQVRDHLLLHGTNDLENMDRNEQTPLHSAADLGYEETILVLIENGSKVDPRDRNGWTPFHCAATQSNLMCCAKLLEKGSNPCATSEEGSTPMHYLVRYELPISALPWCFQLIRESEDQKGKEGKPFQRLIEMMENEDQREKEEKEKENSKEQEENDQKKNGFGSSDPSKSLQALESDEGTRISASAPPLDYLDTIESESLILKRKRSKSNDVKKVSDSPNEKTRKDITLFFGLLELVINGMKFPLELQNDAGETLLHSAAVHCRPHSVAWLCANGAPLDLQKKYGYTALHLAIQRGDLHSVRILLAYGADVSIISQDGNAIDFAHTLQRYDILRLLLMEGKLNGPRNLLPSMRRLRHLSGFVTRKLSWMEQGEKDGEEEKESEGGKNGGNEGKSLARIGSAGKEYIGKKIDNGLDCVYTLHSVCSCHHPSRTPFYVSEVVPDTINPEWLYMDIIKLSENKNLPSNFVQSYSEFFFRIYARPSDPNKPTPLRRHPVFCKTPFSDACGPSCPSAEKEDGKSEKDGEVEDPILQVEGMEGMKAIHEINVFLKDLGYVGPLESISPYFKQNTVLFQLSDGLYATPETIKSMSLTSSSPIESTLKRSTPSMTTERVRSPSLIRIKHFVNIHQSYRYFSKKNTVKTAAEVTKKLGASREFLRLRSKLSGLQYRVDGLRKRVEEAKKELEGEKKRVGEHQGEILPRAKAIGKGQTALIARRKRLQEDLKVYDADLGNLKEISWSIGRRQKFLVGELEKIHPITISDKMQCLSGTRIVSGLALPDTHDFAGCDEELIATALGYVCHIVQLLSRWYDIPLRYPVKPMGSRSLIFDEISHPNSPVFPLYSRGGVRKEFREAVCLLNANIQQLLTTRALKPVGTLSTLPNLLVLFNTAASNALLSKYKQIKKYSNLLGTLSTLPNLLVLFNTTSLLSKYKQIKVSG